MIQATFNIINQKYGAATPYATFLNALGDLPGVRKESKGLPPLYATFNISNKDLTSLCTSLGINYWNTVKAVITLCLSSHELEIEKYGKPVSLLENLPVYFRANRIIRLQKVNENFPNALDTIVIDEEDDSEVVVLKTFEKWDSSSEFMSDGEDHIWGGLRVNTNRPSMEFILEFMQWAEDNPQLEITFLTLEDIDEIKERNADGEV